MTLETPIPAGVTVYFIRHGETDWNVAGRMQGRADIPLNAKGCEQAARNGLTLKAVLADSGALDFIASPMVRARKTMQIIRQELSLPADGARLDDRLAELSFGDFEGKTWAEVTAVYPDEMTTRKAGIWDYRPPGGESYGDLQARIRPVFQSLTRDTIMVAHGGVMRCLEQAIRDYPKGNILKLDVPQDKIMVVADGKIGWV